MTGNESKIAAKSSELLRLRNFFIFKNLLTHLANRRQFSCAWRVQNASCVNRDVSMRKDRPSTDRSWVCFQLGPCWCKDLIDMMLPALVIPGKVRTAAVGGDVGPALVSNLSLEY